MPRRRRPLSATGLAAAAAAAAAIVLAPMTGRAQTPPPDPSIDLLQPSPQGNPKPPRFRRSGDPAATTQEQAPPPGKFTAPSRIGATPIYGSPTGFGAGDTGYDSTNRSRRKRQAQTPGPRPPGAPLPETTFAPLPTPATPPAPPKPPARKPPAQAPAAYPAKAAARPGALLPQPPTPVPISNPPPEVHPLAAAGRPGAVVPVPPPYNPDATAATPPPGTLPLNTLPLGTLPQRALPFAEPDPYAALGIRAGSFLILPAVELSAGYDTNPQHIPGGGASSYFVVAPEVLVQSNWSRHSLTADIRGSYTAFGEDFAPSLNRPYLDSRIDGRIDVTRQTQINLESRFIVSTDNPGSPNIQAGLARLPINTTVGGTAGIAQQFNRLDVSVKGTVDRSTYNNSVLTDGESSTNDDRNFNQYGGIFRVGYEIDPAVKPFVEVDEDTRVHDLHFDRDGLQRDSKGTSAKVGSQFDVFGSLTGEIAVGYLQRDYKDPTLPTIGGAIADGSLIWQATPLTTAKLTAVSTINETILPGVSGAFSRDFNIQVDQALRRWLIGTVIVGYGRDKYVGSPRDDSRYFASAGLTYKLNRDLQIKTTVRHDWLTSSVTGVAYNSTSALVTLRLQR